MVLPFVRDLFADVEKLPAFLRVASHLREGAGRIRVSGLTPTAKALLLVLLQKSAGRSFILIVPDNRAAEELVPVLRAFHELIGGNDPDSIVSLPTRDVLPFQNLSPHPEIQEERAVALWRIATGAVSILVSPVAATALRLRSSEYYADLARMVRRGETLDTEPLLRHLNTVGYASTDVVEMPGEYAIRGGILDVYSPEADRPLRIELFGDEVESIRKFDPATQRSSTAVDEALLLPLTETPISDDLLGAIHVRLSGKRIAGAEEVVEQAIVLASAGNLQVQERKEHGNGAEQADAELGVAYPADELEWLATILFNLAVDYYVGEKEERGAKWARKAVELAHILATSWDADDGGLLVSVFRGKMAELGWGIRSGYTP